MTIHEAVALVFSGDLDKLEALKDEIDLRGRTEKRS